ncbi:cell division protein ZipA C-terminal FtsZ-binding domain-containing protein [Wohlfahrtiimonas larvae]|uniref:Cell division protein ZipA n=1 Tax=Wohlfahrtiimonas larvae TaxID=1157986 RepID=A0ABP9MLQ5_9GAMM|nr:cell division protein ZipA C-terminal FtsZ-binding domain-containing protein [Wohlfahrtiimonas larvae]
MLGSIGSIILLIIIVGCIVYWFVLKKQIDEEDGDRIEPSIDSSFSEFSQKELPKDQDKDMFEDDGNDIVASNAVKTEETIESVSQKDIHEEKVQSEQDDLITEAQSVSVEAEVKKGFFARMKESLMGNKEVVSSANEENLARPAAIRTVALILKAPDDQPYLGQEVLEVGHDLKLMIGGEGFLQQIVTTYLGDEPMYSIAHMIHPGSFNDPEILKAEIPGLLFFAQIPGPDAHMNTVQYMLKAAAFFGQELGGTLLDENQRPVDQEYVQKLLSDISEIEQQAWAKHRANH